MTTATIQTCECPKCGGSGYIAAFAGIAQGVCFTCDGSGRVKAGRFKPAPPMSDHARKCVEWIINATDEQIQKLNYKQLLSSMNTACWHYAEYPDLKSIWEAKFRDAFNVAQEIRRVEYLDKFSL